MNTFAHKLEIDTPPRGDCGFSFSCRSCPLNKNHGSKTAVVHSELPETHGNSDVRQVQAKVWANPSLNGPFEKVLEVWGLKPSYENHQKAPAVALSQRRTVYKAQCGAGMSVAVRTN